MSFGEPSSRIRDESRNNRQPERSISAATISAAAPSASPAPVSTMTTPEVVAATEP
jgi:hypothetical protein